MQQSRAQAFDPATFWRTLPMMLGALLSVVAAVDILLALQPSLLDDWGRTFRSTLTLRPVFAPWAEVLAATLAIGAVVISSAVLLAFARATAVAPQLSLTPAWVALCMLSLARVQTPLPLPASPTVFAILSALLFVGGGTVLRQQRGSSAGTVFGWSLVALPLVAFGVSYASASSTVYPFGLDAGLALIGLLLSAIGVALVTFMAARGQGADDPALDGVNVVDELFAQIERAERSEARAAELERQLNAARRTHR